MIVAQALQPHRIDWLFYFIFRVPSELRLPVDYANGVDVAGSVRLDRNSISKRSWKTRRTMLILSFP